ncbi:tetratricopeptide repeat protein [archaeon]|nr:MAG: tetratricopeptide repeat protein [archaeon]
MTDNKHQTVFHIIEYLNALKGAGANADNIDTITSLLESEFNVSFSPDNFKQYSTYPAGLEEIVEAGKASLNLKSFADAEEEAKANPKFSAFLETVVNKGYFQGTEEGTLEYLRRYAKLVKKFQEKAASAGPSKEDLEKQAEEMKLKGNSAIAQKDYKTAVEHYSEAIKLSSEGPNSHVYYCNRAAASCYLNQYEDAVNDCLSSVALSPDYVKAFSRLGLAYYHLEKFQEALDAYERAAELEPDNAATKDR